MPACILLAKSRCAKGFHWAMPCSTKHGLWPPSSKLNPTLVPLQNMLYLFIIALFCKHKHGQLSFEIHICVLIICLCLAHKFLIVFLQWRFNSLTFFVKRHPKLFNLAHRREYRQAVVLKISQVLISCHEGPWMIVWCKDILPCEPHLIRKTKHRE